MNNSFYEREYTCPICETTFTSLSVKSSSVYVEKKESDFHTIYKGVSPLHYSIVVCPMCEYAASNTTFPKAVNRTVAEQLAIALSRLKSQDTPFFGGERDLPLTLKAFQLAIRTAQLKKVGATELSGLLLAAAWIARELNDVELEKVYLSEALKHYLEAYNNGNGAIGNLSEIQVTYLIGELFRRCANYSEAVNWFNKVICHKDVKNNPNIEKLAREMWSLARDESKSLVESENEIVTQDKQKTTPIASPIDEKENRKLNKSNYSSKPSYVLMSVNLYSNQIDWLKKISNQGYTNTNKLFSREQVLRSAIAAMIELIGDNLPQKFTNEEELINELKEILVSKG